MDNSNCSNVTMKIRFCFHVAFLIIGRHHIASSEDCQLSIIVLIAYLLLKKLKKPSPSGTSARDGTGTDKHLARVLDQPVRSNLTYSDRFDL